MRRNTCFFIIFLLLLPILLGWPYQSTSGLLYKPANSKTDLKAKAPVLGVARTTSNEDTPDPVDNYERIDGKMVEMIVGVNHQKLNAYDEIRFLVDDWFGDIVNEVDFGSMVEAIVVNVPESFASEFVREVRTLDLTTYVEPNIKFYPTFTPNDPHWSSQWGPQQISADWAWNTTLGDSSILVAVIDTGIDHEHPDLAANYAPLGFDWVDNDADPMDEEGHGTHCAGIIAAEINNHEGIAGIAQIKIMAERGLGPTGGYSDDLANAIKHAVNRDADILSLSWGGYVYSNLIHNAIKYAYANDVLVVSSAGNEATDQLSYPASYPEVVAVTATNSYDNFASFSNYGAWVELAAPGDDVYSTYLDGLYTSLSGTSMSCPHVVGCAALALSQYPTMTKNWIRQWLRYTSDDLGSLGFDENFGHGRINAKNVVEQAPPTHDLIITNLTAVSVDLNQTVEANVDVLNFGQSNENNIQIQLKVNGTLTNSTTITSLDAGESASATCYWDSTVQGIHNITCQVLNVTGETLIENNIASTTVLVGVETVKVPQQFASISEAISLIAPFTTIEVASGTYTENLLIRKPLALVGAGSTDTSIAGKGYGMVIHVLADNVNITRVIVRNSGEDYPYSGILLDAVSNCRIDSVAVRSNAVGIFFWECYNCTIQNSSVTSNTAGAIHVWSSSNCTIRQNAIHSNQRDPFGPLIKSTGLNLTQSSHCLVMNNDIYGNDGHGLLLNYSDFCGLRSNTVLENGQCGIMLNRSISSELHNNTVQDHLDYGLLLDYASYGLLDNNRLLNNSHNLAIKGNKIQHYTHNVTSSNTINGKPISYLLDDQDKVVPPGVGYVAIVSSVNITVMDQTFHADYESILLVNSGDSLVKNVTIRNNEVGLFSYKCDNISIINCEIVENNLGVEINQGSNIGISSGNFTSNMVGAKLVDCLNITMENSILVRNEDGINMDACSNCIFTENTLMENNYGIRLTASLTNKIFHNNFLNNTVQATVDENQNLWDNGYPSGGNYWNDHTGPDTTSGPNQNETGNDGLVDNPVSLNSLNEDRYPLTKPFEDYHYDIAVMGISPSATQINGGESLNITVQVKNLQDVVGTFNLSISYNETVFGTHSIAYLLPNETREVLFTWSTVGIAAGNYTLHAEATSVSGETNTGNNLFVNGQIQILPAHNVAITAITFSRFTFPPNYLTTMNLTVQNKGTFSETFNVSAYVEATQLGNYSLSLNSGESVELTFDWDSSGMPYGNYTAYAIVETAVNETSLEDNYIETQITIVWPYDVTGDNYVGIDDIVAIAERFGTTHPTYDVNGDDYVGIDDIVETAEHFGESI